MVHCCLLNVFLVLIFPSHNVTRVIYIVWIHNSNTQHLPYSISWHIDLSWSNHHCISYFTSSLGPIGPPYQPEPSGPQTAFSYISTSLKCFFHWFTLIFSDFSGINLNSTSYLKSLVNVLLLKSLQKIFLLLLFHKPVSVTSTFIMDQNYPFCGLPWSN